MKLGAVIVNYNNYKETLACLQSLLKNTYRMSICIVDNGSYNNSYHIIKQKIKKLSRVKVLRSETNLGYSGGNNIGIDYFKRKKIENIIIATSDTRVLTSNLEHECQLALNNGNAVMGPCILENNKFANPVEESLSISYLLNIFFPKLAKAIKKLYQAFVVLNRKNKTYKKTKRIKSKQVFMVHGCFLLLTSYYFSKFNKLDDSLFLYGEEDIISFNCATSNLPIYYNDCILVEHRCGKSSAFGDKHKDKIIDNSLRILRKKLSFFKLLLKLSTNYV